MDLHTFEHSDWTSIWAGTWRLLTCSHFSDQYTKELLFHGKPFQDQSIIHVSEGKSTAWMRQSDRDRLGTYLAGQVRENKDYALQVSNKLKEQVDDVREFIRNLSVGETNDVLYAQLWDKITEYYQPHISVKYIVDYLDPNELEELLPHFEEARIYAEPVFKESEEFMQKLAEFVGERERINPALISCLLKEELLEYLRSQKLPAQTVLLERNEKAVLLSDASDFKILSGIEAQQVEALMESEEQSKCVKGAIAFPGLVKGRVKVVLDPKNVVGFEQGDILVAGMTRPEYLPIMHKAAAFVTDAGGILSHAAITARELKKPCVIGTQNASKVFKDGDTVEVDANKGFVRIIK